MVTEVELKTYQVSRNKITVCKQNSVAICGSLPFVIWYVLVMTLSGYRA